MFEKNIIKVLNLYFGSLLLEIKKDLAIIRKLKEKKKTIIKIAEINAKKKLKARLEWKLKTRTKRLQIANQNISRQKSQRVFSKKTNKNLGKCYKKWYWLMIILNGNFGAIITIFCKRL